MARQGVEKITIGKLSFQRTVVDRIGVGTFSSVYRGSFEDVKEAAIKRVQKDRTHLDVHRWGKADDHPNVVRYYCIENGDFEFT